MANSPAPSLRKTKKDDVEALLSDLDNLGAESATTPSTHAKTGADDAQSLLDDLDDLVKRRAPTPKRSEKPSLLTSSSSSTPLRSTATPVDTQAIDGGSTSKSLAASNNDNAIAPLEDAPLSSQTEAIQTINAPVQPSWGNWWNSATKLADQARAELEKRAAVIQSQVVDSTKEASEGIAGSNVNPAGVPWAIAQNVNSFIKNNRDLNKLKADFSKAGMKGWNELLNVVVPPIEKHEILSVTLSHDMVGFEGISDVVFTVLQRVMEAHASSQSSEHQLVVNKAPERNSLDEAAKPSEGDDANRNLRPVTGFEQGWKLAESKLSQMVETSAKATVDSANNTSGITLPITTCPLYIRLQPVLDSIPGLASTTQSQASHLYLQVLLQDPSNALTHRTISQPIPKAFIDLDFEEHAWVEELLSESIQGALQNIALEYIQGRNLGTSVRDDAVKTSDDQRGGSES